MKTTYLDTNIILGLLRHQDPIFGLLPDLTRSKKHKYVTGSVTILEIACVLGREEKTLKGALESLDSSYFIPEILLQQPEVQISLITDYLFNSFPLSVLDDPASEYSTHLTAASKISPIVKLASKIASSVKLRSLDCFHFATALYHSQVLAEKIDYLVTSDQGFYSQRLECQNVGDILIVSLEQFIDLEFVS